jgi:hypothetical protein
MEDDRHEFPDEHESPAPVRLPGEPPVPSEPHASHHHEPREVVDEPVDVFGAEEATTALVERLEAVSPSSPPGHRSLSPPYSPERDRVDGPARAPATLVVFGAFGPPSSRPLGHLLTSLRERHVSTLAIAWRHYPDPSAHPHAATLALAAEAAATLYRFWPLAHELLRLHHDDPRDLHGAFLRAGVDPRRALDAMRAGTGIDRMVDPERARQRGAVLTDPLRQRRPLPRRARARRGGGRAALSRPCGARQLTL